MGSQLDSQELLAFELPYKHRSGTDLMLKHILLDLVVKGGVINTLVGPDAKDKYSPWPAERLYGNKSDVVYISSAHNAELHPTITRVQHFVNNVFILRLMSYAVSACRENKKQPPIVMTFIISSIKYEVTKRTTRSKKYSSLM